MRPAEEPYKPQVAGSEPALLARRQQVCSLDDVLDRIPEQLQAPARKDIKMIDRSILYY